jgi:hypothetical protein
MVLLMNYNFDCIDGFERIDSRDVVFESVTRGSTRLVLFGQSLLRTRNANALNTAN